MLPTGACHGQARLRSAGKTLAAAFGCAKYRALQPSSARALVDRKPKLGTIPNVANAIRMAEDDDGMTLGRTVLFIGAGCSKSAGIPLATEIAKRLVVRLAKKMKAADKKIVNETVAYRWLASSHIMRDCCSGPPHKS